MNDSIRIEAVPKEGDLITLQDNKESTKPDCIVIVESNQGYNNSIGGFKIKIKEIASIGYKGESPITEGISLVFSEKWGDKILKNNATEEDLEIYAAAMRVI
jgi:hypothetical protein